MNVRGRVSYSLFNLCVWTPSVKWKQTDLVKNYDDLTPAILMEIAG